MLIVTITQGKFNNPNQWAERGYVCRNKVRVASFHVQQKIPCGDILSRITNIMLALEQWEGQLLQLMYSTVCTICFTEVTLSCKMKLKQNS